MPSAFRYRSALLLTAAAATASACGSATADVPEPSPTAPPTETERRVFRPEELGVDLDESGRPYDTSREADEISVETLGSVVIPDGELRVMDGSAIEVDPFFFADESSPVDFDTETLETSIVWEHFDEFDVRSVLAVVLSVPDSTVAEWQPFEYAYGTDGGVGGFTSQSVIDVAAQRDDTEDDSGGGVFELNDDDLFVVADYSENINTFDLDETPGIDTLIFANGFGDGGFPMTRGLDNDGRLVSLAILDTRYPWRLAFPDGTPPADITLREAEIEQCLAGERDVEVSGTWIWCVSDL